MNFVLCHDISYQALNAGKCWDKVQRWCASSDWWVFKWLVD